MLDLTLRLNTKLLEVLSMGKVLPQDYGWFILVFFVIFITLTLHALTSFALKKIGKRFEYTYNMWDDALINAIKPPLETLIWLIGAIWVTQILAANSGNDWNKQIGEGFELGIIVMAGWFFMRLIGEVEKSYIEIKKRKNETPDITTVHAVNKILKATVFITTTVIIMQTVGISISGVLAVGGVGGLAVGFAAQDLLANFFGAIMIYIDKPFKVGEWVRSPDREIEGTVEEIGWRMTRIKTFNQRPLYVPNRVFTSIAVENPSRMAKRQINESIGIRYCDLPKVEKIVAEIKQKLLENDDIDKSRSLIVSFDSYGNSSVNILVYCFSHTTAFVPFFDAKQKVLVDIKNVIQANGADFAFPTSVVHIEQGE